MHAKKSIYYLNRTQLGLKQLRINIIFKTVMIVGFRRSYYCATVYKNRSVVPKKF